MNNPMFSMFRPFDTARDMLCGKNRHYALHERFLAFFTPCYPPVARLQLKRAARMVTVG
jgi:hypothetical protein